MPTERNNHLAVDAPAIPDDLAEAISEWAADVAPGRQAALDAVAEHLQRRNVLAAGIARAHGLPISDCTLLLALAEAEARAALQTVAPAASPDPEPARPDQWDAASPAERAARDRAGRAAGDPRPNLGNTP